MPGPIDGIIAYAADSIATLARGVALERGVAGWISAAQFERELRIELARGWAAAFKAGLGEQPTRAQEQWLQREYNKHDRFVKAFRADIEAGNLSEAQIANRAAMYADRLRGLYEAGTAAAHGLALPFTPGSGATQCLTNCKCVLEYEEQEGETVAIWTLTPAEHCDDCLALDGLPHTEWKQAIGKGGPGSGRYPAGSGGNEGRSSGKISIPRRNDYAPKDIAKLVGLIDEHDVYTEGKNVDVNLGDNPGRVWVTSGKGQQSHQQFVHVVMEVPAIVDGVRENWRTPIHLVGNLSGGAANWKEQR